MDNLNRFYQDENLREDVKTFFLEELDRVALERVYENKETKGIADAKEVIEKSFVELQERYGKRKKVEVINHSR